jgi:hypothetical protein
MTFDEISKLVSSNNNSKKFSDDFVICLIWKESNFDPTRASTASSATGLMMITKGAVEFVNKHTPAGVHFEHSEMTDGAKNIQCGTYYLDLCVEKLAGVDKSYGTGPGYSKSIEACEKCLGADREHYMACLHKIHK